MIDKSSASALGLRGMEERAHAVAGVIAIALVGGVFVLAVIIQRKRSGNA